VTQEETAPAMKETVVASK